MKSILNNISRIEVLEARIAPAAVIPAAGHVGDVVVPMVVNSITLLQAGDTLSTQGTGGTFLMYVESGTAMVFHTDLNKNGVVDPNEITGVAAGAGLSLISFVDIHGDIVTDLKANGTLTDADTSPSSPNNSLIGGDGRDLVPNSSISKIELRSLTVQDLFSDQNGNSTIDQSDVLARLSLSSYSIYGNIFAAGGFGTADGKGGLIIDTTGATLQAQKFTLASSFTLYTPSTPTIGSIFVGTATSGQSFTFGASDLIAGTVGSAQALNVGGTLTTYTPIAKAAGGSITGVSAVGNVLFNLDGLYAGDGGAGGSGAGFGGAGGSIVGVTLGGDSAGGYTIRAGDGGDGANGGQGGSVTNFSDLASVTGQVTIETGDGGMGIGTAATVGIGGNGGKATFGTMNVFGNVQILLGDGGDGMNKGGNGRSLKTLTFTTGQGSAGGSSGSALIATWRDPGSTDGNNLGRTLPIDFNGDGIGDYVFTTTTPNELVVQMSDGVAFDRYELALAGTPSSLAIGDFNGDGTPDIAIAYQDAGGTAGVGIYSGSVQNGVFVFNQPHLNPIPHLLTYANSQGTDGNLEITGQPITSLVTGDFNRDGFTDVALAATYKSVVLGVQQDIVMFLQGDGKGNVFANFSNSAVPFINVGVRSTTNFLQLQAAGLGPVAPDADPTTNDESTDVLFYGRTGSTNDRALHELDFSTGTPVNTTIQFGQVDTNRKIIDNGTQQISSQDVTLQNFTVGDLNGDGFADLAVLTKQPTGYLITYTGDGTTFTKSSRTGNQAGILLVSGDSDSNPTILSDGFTAAGLSITANPNGGDGSQLAVYGTVSTPAGDSAQVYTVSLSQATDPTLPVDANATLDAATKVSGPLALGLIAHPTDQAVPLFDTYRADANTVGFVSLLDGNANPRRSATSVIIADETLPLPVAYFLNITGLLLQAGDGGEGLTKQSVGGRGGIIGGGALGVISIDGSGFGDSVDPSTGINLVAGDGGNAGKTAGDGGSISGVRVTFNTSSFIVGSTLIAGNGGNGGTAGNLKSTGGLGGNLFNNNILGGTRFTAGDGGTGNLGGAGGSVLGNGLPNSFDTAGGGAIVIGGRGGDGTNTGGAGGSVTNFVNSLYIITNPAGISLLQYIGGDGGNGGTGAGGAGGSVLNSSPRGDINGFGGEIYLKGGDGGLGASGGAGGRVKNFFNSPTEGNQPRLATVLGGTGGDASDGIGGKGGNVGGVIVSGTAFDNATSTPQADLVLAGAGGASANKTGGAGGSITSVEVTSAGGAVVIGAGAGGAGGKNGGSGGSVTSVIGNASGASTGGTLQISKVLIAAGAGGDGDTGKGGIGGSITGVKQKGNILTNVDVIAGNGGSVTNGTATSKVGRGGSISNVNLDGTLGDISPTNPITSYGVAADFLATLRQSGIDYASGTSLTAAQVTNDNGNTGLIAGAAGSLNGVAGSPAKNGSVTNLTARAIMSMVAGNVDNIAFITSVKNIALSLGATADFGSDKNYPDPQTGTTGTVDYLDQNDVYTNTVVVGGTLIDGAIASQSKVTFKPGLAKPTNVDRVFDPA